MPALLVLSVSTVLLLTWTDSTRVSSRAEQAEVSFGFPLNWVSQDLSYIDPPLPEQVSLSSPWEHPTDVFMLPLLVDVGVVLAVLAVLTYVGRILVGRRRARSGAT